MSPVRTENMPVVEFDNGVEYVVGRSSWDMKQGSATVASRNQVPLTLGYAITIHKSQVRNKSFKRTGCNQLLHDNAGHDS